MAACKVVTPRGPCRMAALKDGSSVCFIHSERTSAARTRARAKGGAAQKQRQALPRGPAPATTGGFELGKIERRGDVARTLVRLARAIAKGEVDPKTGRLVADALRAASAAAGDAALADDDGAPIGARELEAHELDYVIKNGQLPPDVVEVGPTKWWVAGPVWQRPSVIKGPVATDDPEAS